MDTLSRAERSERMSRVRSKDTRPELLVRRLTHAAGFRYRLHDKRLPGRPDMVFRGRRKVVFVHGCFWHRHSNPDCKLARMPKSRLDFWKPKLDANRERDKRVQGELAHEGWETLIVWECETRRKECLKNKIIAFLEGNKDRHESR